MTETKQVASSSFPVLGLLGAVLVVLKLLGKISISWWWVLAPFWIVAVFAIVAIVVLLMFAFVFMAIEK